MASNYTPNYKLNQWEAEDKVQRTDFNADNAKIDAALAKKAEASALTSLQAAVAKKAEQSALAALQTTVDGKASQSALAALETTVAGKGNCRLEMGSYRGKGTATVSINTSFPPQVIIVMGPLIGVAVRGYDQIHFTDNYPRYADVTWRNNGITWTYNGSGSAPLYLNSEGTTYYYAVFG